MKGNIEKMVDKLTTRETWLKKAYCELMEIWEELTKDIEEDMRFTFGKSEDFEIFDARNIYYIQTGCSFMLYTNEYSETWEDGEAEETIEKIRRLFSEFPSILKRLENAIAGRLEIYEKYEELLKNLRKCSF